MYKTFEKQTAKDREWIIKNRRELHQIPETAFLEYKTQEYLLDALYSINDNASDERKFKIIHGSEVTGKETGIIAELDISDGPVIALRFDIDALSVWETKDKNHYPNKEGFASKREGYMHACGHDGHMAIGLACAKLFLEFIDSFKGKIRLIFQPAEEGCKGAKTIVERGHLDDVDYLLSGHIVGREYDNNGNTDVIAGVSSSLATTKINVEFTGRSCHASSPENGANAILSMSTAIKNMEAIVCPYEGKALLNVGQVRGGEGRNIIAGSASMELETRGSTTQIDHYMREQAYKIIKDAADKYGCTVSIDAIGDSPSVESSEALCELALKTCNEEYADIKAAKKEAFRASEDIAVMIERVKELGKEGIFFLYTTDTKSPLHANNYDFNEDVLPKAAAYLCGMVYKLSNKK